MAANDCMDTWAGLDDIVRSTYNIKKYEGFTRSCLSKPNTYCM